MRPYERLVISHNILKGVIYMKKYTVTADVQSEKYGKGKLIGSLTEAELLEYAKLTDSEKLDYLVQKNAKFVVDTPEDLNVESFNIEARTDGKTTELNYEGEIPQTEPKVTRKMRININGQDSGWVDVTEENEEEYNKILEQVNDMHEEYNKRFNEIFNFRGNGFLGLNHPFFRLGNQSNKKDDEK